MSTYLWINLGVVFVPLIASFHPAVKHYRNWRAILFAIGLPGLLFILWDVLFTRWRIWGFNEEHLLGTRFLGLPIEEILFFLAIPYACLFSYEWFRRQGTLAAYSRQSRITLLVVAVALIPLAVFSYPRIYTVSAALVASLFLLCQFGRREQRYGPYFLITYLVIYALPFILVNGLLTGSWISGAVVWYDNAQNLGLRILTIPLEDFIYGMALLAMNVALYEKYRLKPAPR